MHLLRCLVGAGILFTAAAESPVALKPNQIYTLSNTCDEYRARLDALVSDVLGMAHDSSTVGYLPFTSESSCPSQFWSCE